MGRDFPISSDRFEEFLTVETQVTPLGLMGRRRRWYDYALLRFLAYIFC